MDLELELDLEFRFETLKYAHGFGRISLLYVVSHHSHRTRNPII